MLKQISNNYKARVPVKKKALIIFYISIRPARQAVIDNLESFKFLNNYDVSYINVALFKIPKFILNFNYDLIVFHWTFCGLRFNRERFNHIVNKNNYVFEALSGKKLVFPQDEFAHMDLMNDFINRYGILGVATVSPLSEVDKLYREINFEKVKFKQVLTGYVSDKLIKFARKNIKKEILIGYRVVSVADWGEFNLLKSKLAEKFIDIAKKSNWYVDIKIGEKFFFNGEKWLDFLARCKFTIGCEGGASILDWNGEYSKYIKLQANNPDSYKIQSKNKYVSEGEICIRAISPRQFEAISLDVCQILIVGKYNDILTPWRHYIPLEEDFSNIDKVIEAMNDEELVNNIIRNSKRDIILSNKYSYRRFQNDVLQLIDCCHEDSKNVKKHWCTSYSLVKIYCIMCNVFTDIAAYLYSAIKKHR